MEDLRSKTQESPTRNIITTDLDFWRNKKECNCAVMIACMSGSMLEIEPATEVDEKWTIIWMHENNNQSKRRLLIRLSKLI